MMRNLVDLSNMADIDFYRDDPDDNQDDVYGLDDGLDSDDAFGADDSLTPLQKLEKYMESDNVYTRQMVARGLLDTLRAVGETDDDCIAVLNAMVRISEDTDPIVRSELMEQVPHLAVYCQENQHFFVNAVPRYILPMVVRYLNDSNNQVRKTSQAALLVLLEQELVEKDDIEEQVVNVILDLASPDSLDDYRTEAVALMSKMSPMLGKEMTKRLFLPRYCEMCSDPLFHVRKVCAANFGDFCTVVGQENVEEQLLAKFYYLCEDGVWGVRKACAECFMAVSCATSLDLRKTELSSLFVNLLCDQSRWVRMAAFQQLGPFISTFADPGLTGLCVNEEGILSVRMAEQLDNRLPSDFSVGLINEINESLAKAQAEQSKDDKSEEEPDNCEISSTRSLENCDTYGTIRLDNYLPDMEEEEDSRTFTLCNNDSDDDDENENIVTFQFEGLSCEERRAEVYKTKLNEQKNINTTEEDGGDSGSNNSAQNMNNLDVVNDESEGSKADSSNITTDHLNIDVPESIGEEESIVSQESEDNENETTTNGAAELDNLDAGRISPDVESEKVESNVSCLDSVGNETREHDSPVPIEQSVEIVSDGDSPSDTSADKQEDLQISIDSSNTFNAFQFWRTPLPELDPEVDLVDGLPKNIQITDTERDEDQNKIYATEMKEDISEIEDTSSTQTPVETSLAQMSVGNSDPESDEVTASAINTVIEESDVKIHTASVSTVSEAGETVAHIGSTHVLGQQLNESSLTVVNGVVQDDGDHSHVSSPPLVYDDFLGHIDSNLLLSLLPIADISSNSFGFADSEFSPSHDSLKDALSCLDDATLAQQQDIIPQSLLENYLGMVDPSRAQTVDTEITKHCAYNLPAVAYTLGRKNWHCIRNLYETLAADMQWKVRRTLAFSIHELAIILGEEITHQDLVPVFDGFLKDLDEVRIGVLRHLADFLRLLRPDVRRRYLTKIQDFMNTDNQRNWRFRLELAEQLTLISELYSVYEISEHILPLALALAQDKVSEVRIVAFRLIGIVMQRLSDGEDEKLMMVLVNELVGKFAHNQKWGRRQMFAQMCQVILEENAVPLERFAKDLLPSLLSLGNDAIPNVRISLAKSLAQFVATREYFTSDQNPHQEDLMKTLQDLQTDSDMDVRYFSSHPPSSETVEEDTQPVQDDSADSSLNIQI